MYVGVRLQGDLERRGFEAWLDRNRLLGGDIWAKEDPDVSAVPRLNTHFAAQATVRTLSPRPLALLYCDQNLFPSFPQTPTSDVLVFGSVWIKAPVLRSMVSETLSLSEIVK